jgi:hypothetical protein
MLLDGLALLTTQGPAAATPTLQQAAKSLLEISMEDALRWGWVAMAASHAVWDYEGMLAIAARVLQLVRDAGALAQLPIHLSGLALAKAWIGDFAGAASLVAEIDCVVAATGSRFVPGAVLRLRALQGREAESAALIASVIEQDAAGAMAIYAHWAAAVLCNGLARYQEAVASARQATSSPCQVFVTGCALPELVEAAERGGDAELAREALERLTQTTQPCGTNVALGIEARCRALLAHGDQRTSSIARRSSGSAARSCGRNLPAPICSMESGCAARAGAPTRASNCAWRTTCSPRSAWRRTPSARAGS